MGLEEKMLEFRLMIDTIKIRIDDGSSTLIWLDNWHPHGVLLNGMVKD